MSDARGSWTSRTQSITFESGSLSNQVGTEQNRTEQNRTEQNRTEQNRKTSIPSNPTQTNPSQPKPKWETARNISYRVSGLLDQGTNIFFWFGKDGSNASLAFWIAHDNGLDNLGKVSGLNVWDYIMEKEQINHMSYGCYGERGNLISWSNVLELLTTDVVKRTSATCHIHQGEWEEGEYF